MCLPVTMRPRTFGSRKLKNFNQNLNQKGLKRYNIEIVATFKDREIDNLYNILGSTSTLSRHEREGEYEETVTVPVQRYADSLRRKHFDDEPQQ